VQVVPTLIVFALVLFDTGFTLLRRLREGKNVLAAHREHLYQRLVASGASHREVTASYAAATAVLGIVALAWSVMPVLIQIGMLALLAAGAGLLVWWVRTSERATTEG
jgi:UDP-N-acetylmuramyl pentapeptide phosphotransferase/UDP-N-acetylglucosamine-1-phosphate transferase